MRPLPPRSAHRLALTVALATVVGIRGPAVAEARPEAPTVEILGRGEPWETPAYVYEGGEDGPTVMIVGGVHGTEPAGAIAADQIRRWGLRRGRLVVVPRANVRALAARRRYTPGVPRDVRNLNRNYPRLPEGAARGPDGRVAVTDAPRGEVAPVLWRLVERYEPDWLLDLHEGHATHRINPKSSGDSVIVHPAQEGARVVADLMIAAVNETIEDPARHFARLRQITRSTFARSAADHFGVRTLILETCYTTGPLSRRTRRHRSMVYQLLSRLEMLAEGVGIDTLLPVERDGEDLRVAVYDAEGTGGPGVSKALAQIGGGAKTTVARVCPEDVRGGALAAFDVVTFTGGSGSGQARALGEAGRLRIRDFVESGGGFVGVCAGAYLALSGFSWSLGLLDGKTVSPLWRRGQGRVEMEPTREGLRILDLPADPMEVRYGNGPVFEPFGSDDLADYEVWALYRTELAANGSPKGVMVDSPAIAAGRFGRGRVVVIGPHPEQTKGLETILPCAAGWAAGAGAPGR